MRTGTVTLRDLAVAEKGGAELLSVPRLALTLDSSDLTARKIHVAEILCRSPSLNLFRDRRGSDECEHVSLLP